MSRAKQRPLATAASRKFSWFQMSTEKAATWVQASAVSGASGRDMYWACDWPSNTSNSATPPARELLMNAHGVAQEQVARSRQQNRGGEAGEVAIDGREQRLLQVVRAGIKPGGG